MSIDINNRTKDELKVSGETDIISGERYIALCSGGSTYKDHETNMANAAFIVTACNNHDKLIEALKETNAALNKIIETGKKENNHVNFFLFDSWCNDIHLANEKAKKLLNEIEKETL